LLQGEFVQRRVFLLFMLFVVLAGFYASVTSESMPRIESEQKAQTDQFNHLDELATGKAAIMPAFSGN
jgi:hypothetical protein